MEIDMLDIFSESEGVRLPRSQTSKIRLWNKINLAKTHFTFRFYISVCFDLKVIKSVFPSPNVITVLTIAKNVTPRLNHILRHLNLT